MSGPAGVSGEDGIPGLDGRNGKDGEPVSSDTLCLSISTADCSVVAVRWRRNGVVSLSVYHRSFCITCKPDIMNGGKPIVNL